MHHSLAAPSRPTAYLVPAHAILGTRNKHTKSMHGVLITSLRPTFATTSAALRSHSELSEGQVTHPTPRRGTCKLKLTQLHRHRTTGAGALTPDEVAVAVVQAIQAR